MLKSFIPQDSTVSSMNKELDALLKIGDELHQKHSLLENNYGVDSGYLIEYPLSFSPSTYIQFIGTELKHTGEIILDYIEYIDDWMEFLDSTEENFRISVDSTDNLDDILKFSENEEIKQLPKEEIIKRFNADFKELKTGYQNLRNQLINLLPDLLEAGDELWRRQVELDNIYNDLIHSDGGASWSLRHIWVEGDEEKFKKKYLAHIKDCMKELKLSIAAFKKQMKTADNEWIQRLPEDIRSLPKEEIIRKVEAEYCSLLIDYEKLKALVTRRDISFEIQNIDAPKDYA